MNDEKEENLTWKQPPKGMKSPEWYKRIGAYDGFHIWFGIVFRRFVFNFDTPWFGFGYAW